MKHHYKKQLDPYNIPRFAAIAVQLDWLAGFGEIEETSIDTKQCSSCDKIKKIDLFELKTTYITGRKGYSSVCRACAAKNQRVIMRLKRNSPPPAPGTLCAVPNCKNEAICLDHDHITETKRDYVCRQHNTAFALCGDSASGVMNLLEYAKRWEK